MLDRKPPASFPPPLTAHRFVPLSFAASAGLWPIVFIALRWLVLLLLLAGWLG